jgi:hypothetical protein
VCERQGEGEGRLLLREGLREVLGEAKERKMLRRGRVEGLRVHLERRERQGQGGGHEGRRHKHGRREI